MKVRELIDRLLDQPMNNTVYVGDISHGVNERGWDGELQEVVGQGPGVFATFLGFNETGVNNYIDTEVCDDPAPEPTNVERTREWWIENANVNDAEDCEACEGDLCPVHHGISVGIDLMARKIAALGDDPELFNFIPEPKAPGGRDE